MENYYLGTAIRELRKKKNLTLEELADGICSKRQLQRVETNVNIPSGALLADLSQKLNENIETYFMLSEDINPIELHTFITEVDELYHNSQYDTVYHLTCDYLGSHDKLTPLAIQIIGNFKAQAAYYSKTIKTLDVNYTESLLKLSLEYDTLEEACSGFRTIIESILLSNLINHTFLYSFDSKPSNQYKEDLERGFNLLVILCKNYAKSYRIPDPKFCSRLLCNVAYTAFLLDRYEDCLEICNYTIHRYGQNTTPSLLGSLQHKKGLALIKLKDVEAGKKCFSHFIQLKEMSNSQEPVIEIINALKIKYNL
ncbi:MAG: helix-turn-helix domain-containing protein [Turicibacter sp.]